MSCLTIYPEDAPEAPVLRTENPETISAMLKLHGVRFERWAAPAVVPEDASAEHILQVFRPHLDALLGGRAGTADVMQMRGATEAYAATRRKFLDEHTHTEDEVRFFVHGSGNFSLHLAGQVFAVDCTQGDLISVPCGTKHWFDAGLNPSFTVLRIFSESAGWTPHYTGDAIAERFAVPA